MTIDEKRWQQVNAYVDGELDAAAAADVAAAVARDRALANAVAAVTQLKAATAGNFENPAISLDPARPPWRWAALAASLMLGIGLAAAVALYGGRPDLAGSLAKAVERHVSWAAADSTEAGTELPGATLAGLAQLGFAADIPDLSDAGLMLAQVSVVEARDGSAAFQIRYIGTRGCRVSLLAERAGSEGAVGRQDIGTVRVASWLVRDLRYTLLASGMYDQRFATIAATAEASTRRDRPSVDQLRQALRDQREQSPPCLG